MEDLLFLLTASVHSREFEFQIAYGIETCLSLVIDAPLNHVNKVLRCLSQLYECPATMSRKQVIQETYQTPHASDNVLGNSSTIRLARDHAVGQIESKTPLYIINTMFLKTSNHHTQVLNVVNKTMMHKSV